MNSARQQALSARRMMTSGIDTSSRAADPIQDAVYNRVLMATMAGRRMMVVSDYTGRNGAVTGRRIATYMSSSDGMALTATGYRNATLEDLLSEAAAGLGLKRSGDLEELALSLEQALDAAGSGLLVVFDAHLLSAPVIGDLFELSGSDTDSGLYMQILLTGGPGLDAQFDKPGLASAAGQVASSRWRIENEAPVEEEQPAPSPAPRPMAAAARREPAPAAIPQPAFTRQRAQRREEDLAAKPAFEPPPLHEAPRAYAVQPDPHLDSRQEAREPVRSSRRVYWVLALGILFAFAAGFVTNALWPFAPKSTTELLKGDGLSALTANLPSTPLRPVPVEPQAQPEPDPAPSAPAPETPAVAAPPPAPATQPAPAAAALPPEWNQPVERSRPSNTRSVPAAAPPADRPVVAAPTPLTRQPQQAEVPPSRVAQQPAKAAAPADVCREGAGVPKPPQNSLSGIAEGFMTDLRSLGRCLNSLAR